MIPVRVGDTVVPREVMTNVLGFFIVFVLAFMIGVFVMAALGLDMATSFGASIEVAMSKTKITGAAMTGARPVESNSI